MIGRRATLLCPSFAILLLYSTSAFTQSPTTGRIKGSVTDPTGAVVVGAEVTITNRATGQKRKSVTDSEGNYSASGLEPGIYRVSVEISGLAPEDPDLIKVQITETVTVDVKLKLTGPDPTSVRADPVIQDDGPQRGRMVDSRELSELPLATQNFTQASAFTPGVNVALPNSTALGRNSQNISVNGARVQQNNFEINGVDANKLDTNSAVDVAVPAPETIQEFKVQTSLYDATFGRSAGGNIQAVTRSGGNNFHGAAYEYFRNDALNANNPFLKFAGIKRPTLQRNAFGGLLGGPIKTNKSFFFVSYQGTHERNGASPNSLTSDVSVVQGLTDDRSEQTLVNNFLKPIGSPATSIDSVALALLNAKLPNGQFLIPTPQADGHYSNSAISTYREDQFNANFDYRINEKNSLALKFFFSNAPQFLALLGQTNVPGFGSDRTQNNRVLSIQDIHILSPRTVNEARAGGSFIREDTFGRNPVHDSDVGIIRSNADVLPGLGQIRIGPLAANSVTIGSPTTGDVLLEESSTTFVDILSLSRGPHSIRIGAEVINYRTNLTTNNFRRGQIAFSSFTDFLVGKVANSTLGDGINNRILRATDYSFFLQDDWKFSKKLVLNLGLRYELDLPPYDTRGVLSAFDPSLYKPRPSSDTAITGLLVPLAGFVQAGNVIPQYNLPVLPKVDKRVLTSVDGDNFGPRVGFAYSPLASGRLVVRGGYGIFYSRLSAAYLGLTTSTPPNYAISRSPAGATIAFANPFSQLPSQDQFPTFVKDVALAGNTFDRNIRTPYFQQYNTSVQYGLSKDMLLEVAYVGTRGLNLLRNVAINQARLASLQNTPTNATSRAPYQGVDIATFDQIQSTAQSTYNSLQISVSKRLSKGLEFLAAYTYAKSIDNSSGGINSAGETFETQAIRGNQLDNRANRGVSDFDRTHRFVLSYLWDLPRPAFAVSSTAGRWLFSNWQVAGIITAMSGLPIDILDGGAGSLYGLNGGSLNNTLARPSWAPGETLGTATWTVSARYFFNPFAFVRPVVLANQPIPSSILSANGAALADATCGLPKASCTDFGNVGRNVLRGPGQNNIDFSIIKRFPISDSKNVELRAEFFNLFNHVNFANPVSNLNAVASIDPNNGRIVGDPGDFGRITATSNNPRLIQFVVKLNF